ncbi:MAG: molybdopterin oxidoreductase family protein [Vicinamibacteria bacterium]
MITTHKVVCPHDCPDTCVATVQVEDGKAIKIGGDPTHSFTQGFLCAKVNQYLDRVYSPDRILHPLKRVGKKGEGKFEHITWDEALATIAAKFKEAIASDGPESILPYSYAGNMGLLHYGSLDRRFFGAIGASQLDRTICSSAGFEGYKAVVGATIGFDPEKVENAKLIIAWGANIISSNVHFWPFVEEARKKGARLIVIDPYRSRTADKADWHIAPLPGTDGALVLAMMNILFRDGLVDEDYITRYTQGVDGLRARANEWTPARAAVETGLDVATIEKIAREYGTTRPSAIRVNYGLNRAAGGGNAVRLITCLPALTGDWRHVGGGVQLSSSGTYPLNNNALARPEMTPAGTRTINMSSLGEALDPSLKPKVRAMYVYNSNPAAVAPDQNAVRRGLAREDLFVAVHELFRTDTVDWADIVLPATTVLEHTDLFRSYGHLRIALNQPAVQPVGESRSNTDVFRALAKEMGLTDARLFEDDEALLHQAVDWKHARLEGITLERLKSETHARLNVPEEWAPFANGNFPTISGKCEFYSETEKAAGRDPLPNYIPPREGPISNPSLAKTFPLAFISPPAHHFLNSTFSGQPIFVRREGGEPALTIHPDDARARRIVEGQMVRTFNARGEFFAKAHVSDAARRGVVVGLSIWWAKLCPGGSNANAVTGQALTDLGGGATFYDVLVDVEPHEGNVPLSGTAVHVPASA